MHLLSFQLHNDAIDYLLENYNLHDLYYHHEANLDYHNIHQNAFLKTKYPRTNHHHLIQLVLMIFLKKMGSAATGWMTSRVPWRVSKRCAPKAETASFIPQQPLRSSDARRKHWTCFDGGFAWRMYRLKPLSKASPSRIRPATASCRKCWSQSSQPEPEQVLLQVLL